MKASSTVKVDLKVCVTVKVAVATGQVSDAFAEDVWAAPDGDVVVKAPALVIVVWAANGDVGEALPVAMQEHAEEMRVGLYWH